MRNLGGPLEDADQPEGDLTDPASVDAPTETAVRAHTLFEPAEGETDEEEVRGRERTAALAAARTPVTD